MRIFTVSFLFLISLSTISAQNRAEAIDEYKNLKLRAGIVEKLILAPSKEDAELALRENVNVIRILPRETYDNNLMVRGGGAYYSFYFKIPDYGYGSDIALERDKFSIPRIGLMGDLGEVSLNEITKESQQANSLINYQKVKDTNLVYQDFETFRYEGLKAGDTIFKTNLPAIVGHTYILRSINTGYYDIITAFKVQRKDSDGSLIIFWKPIEQFDTPHDSRREKTKSSDAEILKSANASLDRDIFSGVKPEVNNGIVSLRGTILKENLAFAIQLANSSGATKIINLLTIK